MKKFLSILMILTLVFALAACGGGGGEADPVGPDPGVPADNDESITVSSVEELMGAIGSNVVIYVEPGYYNLSEYIESIYYENGSGWDDEHDFMYMNEVFDGVEIVIRNVSSLSIIGQGEEPQDTKFVIEPRYANVFHFEYGDHIYMDNLSIGHTDTGSCVGDVIYLDNCSNVELDNMDLYGCGVNGITAIDCYNLRSDNTYIHHCSWTAIQMEGCSGDLMFNDCTFEDNNYGLSDWDNYDTIVFNNCVFGQEESNSVYFNEDIELIDCDVMEPTVYPDYGY